MAWQSKVFTVLCIFLCVSLTLFLLDLGLYPYNFLPTNEASRVEGGRGIDFRGVQVLGQMSAGGVIHSNGPLRGAVNGPDAGLTIEMFLVPSALPHSHVPAILTGCDPKFKKEHFVIGQWKTSLVLISSIRKSYFHTRKRERGVNDVFEKEKPAFVTVTSSVKQGTSVYLNGEHVIDFPGMCLFDASGNLIGNSLLLGNGISGSRSWSGRIIGLTVFGRVLGAEEVREGFHARGRNDAVGIGPSSGVGAIASYRFDDNSQTMFDDMTGNSNVLVKPKHFFFRQDVLAPPNLDYFRYRSLIVDVILNIAGFVPAGFLFVFLFVKRLGKLKKRGYIAAISIGIALSLIIEIVQVFLPTRSSSLLDLFCNTLGTLLGVLLFHVAVKFTDRRKQHRLQERTDFV